MPLVRIDLARGKPVPPCTAETSQRRAGNSLVPCAFGL